MLPRIWRLARPLIGAADAEKAHELAVRALEWLPLPKPPPGDPRLAVSAMGLAFANPLGIAAGFDKDGRAIGGLNRLGFGFVEIGGVTLKPQPGNPAPRVFRLAADEAVINRYGLNSDGSEAVAARLGRRPASTGVLGINLGANKESVDRIGDYVELVRRLGRLAHFLTLNISSPNTPGLRDLQGAAFLDELLQRVLEARAAAGLSARILVKIAPDLDLIQLDDIVAICRRRGIDGMIVSNTTVHRPATLKERALAAEAGGLSGRPLFRPSTVLLAKTFLRVEGAFPLIGVGGISSGEDAVAKIAAGASLIQLYTALVFQGPGLIGEIKRALLRAMEREGVSSLGELSGRSAKAWAEA